MAGEENSNLKSAVTIGYQLNSDMSLAELYARYEIAGEEEKFSSNNPIVFAAFLQGFFEGVRHDKIKKSNK